jgi:hypothetical protein
VTDDLPVAAPLRAAHAPGDPHGVAIRLSGYGDLFSDFDPRPYDRRALSDDFLAEIAKRRLGRSREAVRLEFLVPRSERRPEDETVIRERLLRHFQERAAALAAEQQRAIGHGIFLSVLGTLMLLGSAFARTYVRGDFAAASLNVLLEPGGWYAIWYGFDELFYGVKRIAADRMFHARMANAEIVFRD